MRTGLDPLITLRQEGPLIICFSGTGNSRWVAGELARLLGDRVADVTGQGPLEAVDLGAEKRVGLVFPVYAWAPPEPFAQLVSRLDVPAGAFVFGVCTYGAEAGYAMRDLARLVRLDAAYGVAMPNNYVMGSELEPRDAALAKVEAARGELARIAEEVAARQRVERVRVGAAPLLKSRIANAGFNRFARTTRPFFVTDACVGCGACAWDCPAGAIGLEGGRPRWRKPTCLMCTRCLNACPTAAIQYGRGTERRGRYSLDELLRQ